MITYRKVGGLRFVRVGRLQMSFCMCRKVERPARLPVSQGDLASNLLLAVLSVAVFFGL